jgi:hypothetical protein
LRPTSAQLLALNTGSIYLNAVVPENESQQSILTNAGNMCVFTAHAQLLMLAMGDVGYG